jgi:hypothetical protein
MTVHLATFSDPAPLAVKEFVTQRNTLAHNTTEQHNKTIKQQNNKTTKTTIAITKHTISNP